MSDLVFIAVALAFFGLGALYIRGCDRILRSGDAADDPTAEVTR